MKRSAELRERANKVGAFAAQLSGQHAMAATLSAAAADLAEFASIMEARERATDGNGKGPEKPATPPSPALA